MRKTLVLFVIILLTFIIGAWIWANVSQPLPAIFVLVLLAVGCLGVLYKRRFLSWAGAGAAWAFYAPVLLALFQVSIGMALIYGGLVALIYGIWAPLLSFEATSWLVRGRISDSQPFQHFAPVLLAVGLAIFVAGLVQIVKSRVHGGKLVTGGLYSVVRHPQYLGVNILALGFVLYGLRPIDFIAWVNLVFLHVLLAEREEARLKEKFGQAYLEYQRQVPFMLPFVPNWLRSRWHLPLGWRRKAVLIAVYLLVMAVLVLVLRAAWIANGALLMR